MTTRLTLRMRMRTTLADILIIDRFDGDDFMETAAGIVLLQQLPSRQKAPFQK